MLLLYSIRMNRNVDNQLEHAKRQIIKQVEKNEDEFMLLKSTEQIYIDFYVIILLCFLFFLFFMKYV